jgi:hypothetical protein
MVDKKVIRVESGKNARVLVAIALRLGEEEFERRVFAESPRYGNK